MYESRDYVSSWYKARHNREINATNAQSINTCFSQAREYFEAAEKAAISVRPLLLYYAVLSMARGTILLRDSTKREDNLKPSHGLEVVDWGNTLSGGISNILDVKFRATGGSFVELANAARSVQVTGGKNFSGANIIFHVYYGVPKFVDGDSTLTLDDLLSRDHRLLGIYAQTTKRESKVHVGHLTSGGDDYHVWIFSHFSSEHDLRSRFGLSSDITVDMTAQSKIPGASFQKFIVHGDKAKNYNEIRMKMPLTQYLGKDAMFVVEDFPDGDRLSELIRTFLLSYVLGMIVRYYPSKWMALLRNEKGDAAQPSLKAAINAIASDYPKLTVSALA
jgi:hypothetical protein